MVLLSAKPLRAFMGGFPCKSLSLGAIEFLKGHFKLKIGAKKK